MTFNPGPRAAEQLRRLAVEWRQGQHILVIGETGSGKTALARHLDEIRIQRGGHVMVFVGKLLPDETITEDYSKKDGWVRWMDWREPTVLDQRVLLWPAVERRTTIPSKRDLQKAVFTRASDKMSNKGKWTLHIDEGLYMVNPSFMNLPHYIASLHEMGRSGELSMITLAQRPSHLPMVVYSSIKHAFVGRTNLDADLKRLAELSNRMDVKSLKNIISQLDEHEFLWISRGSKRPPEILDLGR